MIKNENIICISSIDWDFIWQGHQEIMSAFARNGNRVLFIENTGVRAPSIRDLPRLKKRIKDYFRGIKGIRKESQNLYVFSPILLPFPYSWIARKINRFLLLSILEKWMKVLDFSDPIIWTFLPTGITLDIIDNIHKKIAVYYCIDNFAVSSPAAKKVAASERKLLQKADLVFVTSQALYDYCTQYNKRVSIFPFGVNIESFLKAGTADTEIPPQLSRINKPVVGYVGGVHKWIDQELVKAAALKMPELAFVFIGPLQTDVSVLSHIRNIYFLGSKEHRQLPCLIKYFSVCLIPYIISEYTRNVYPTKLNEYLALGRPVVSTALPEIIAFNKGYGNVVEIASGPEEFSSAILNAIGQDNEAFRKRRIEAAKENSWQSRIEKMSSLIGEAIARRIEDRESMWKEKFRVSYNRARRKFMRLALIFGSAYLLIFYTPFVWWLASPLKIEQAPRSAQAIVVFAGGVGESGRPAQGYEERVQYAVDLYKQGYAPKIIFSSGYMFVFKEPLVMKALAVSLGVPASDIILEDQAKNTYQNVLYTARILRSDGRKEILLVSSPYHMRRAALIFKKLAPDMAVAYTPLPKSSFYAHPSRDLKGRRIYRQVSLRQLRAIVHEYLGIIYYIWKGYA